MSNIPADSTVRVGGVEYLSGKGPEIQTFLAFGGKALIAGEDGEWTIFMAQGNENLQALCEETNWIRTHTHVQGVVAFVASTPLSEILLILDP